MVVRVRGKWLGYEQRSRLPGFNPKHLNQLAQDFQELSARRPPSSSHFSSWPVAIIAKPHWNRSRVRSAILTFGRRAIGVRFVVMPVELLALSAVYEH